MEENRESPVAVRTIRGLDYVNNYNTSSGMLGIDYYVFSALELRRK